MSETELPNSSEGLERVDNVPSPLSLEALSVLPMDFHAQYFTRSSSGKSNVRGMDVWVWYWPVASKDSPTPLDCNEPLLAQRPKSSAIACRLCAGKGKWQAYKLCDGVVSTLRYHLKTLHYTHYDGLLWTDAWEMERRRREGGDTAEPFHLSGFLEHLIQWIVSDDQASSASILSLYMLSDALLVY